MWCGGARSRRQVALNGHASHENSGHNQYGKNAAERQNILPFLYPFVEGKLVPIPDTHDVRTLRINRYWLLIG